MQRSEVGRAKPRPSDRGGSQSRRQGRCRSRQQTKPAGKASPVPLIGAAVGALVLGSVLGIFVVAPRIVTSRTSAQTASAEPGKGEKKKGGKDES